MTDDGNLDAMTSAVITVGEGGRGFVVKGRHHRLVITAAHCLPFLPPAISFSTTEEKTYQALLAPLGEKPSIWAECLFVDYIADIAILGSPDDQDLSEEADAYEELVDAGEAFEISDPARKCRAFLLSLENQWFECTVNHVGGPLWISDAAAGIRGGMSGSPVVAKDGTAIGVMCTSGGIVGKETFHTGGGPNPRLFGNLPGWYFEWLRRSDRFTEAMAGESPLD